MTEQQPGTPAPWEKWAPPLVPPAEDGLPRAEAEEIAAQWWDCDPHMAAALMWESYAATLPPSPPVVSVQTGVQSVNYGQPYAGPALVRAAWHRGLAGNASSLPLRSAMGDPDPDAADCGEWCS